MAGTTLNNLSNAFKARVFKKAESILADHNHPQSQQFSCSRLAVGTAFPDAGLTD